MSSDLIKELTEVFFNKYTNKQETMYRLPMDIDIEEFWSAEIERRKHDAVYLPLRTFDGKPFFYNRTKVFREAADRITETARGDFDNIDQARFVRQTLIEEAYCSSSIEGAFSTKEASRKLIESGKKPKDKSEQMILNNYNALQFIMEHLEYPFDEQMIITIGRLLTEGTLEGGPVEGYRSDMVYVVSHTGETVYIAPDAKYVKPMMDDLIAYLNDPMVHPVEKAAIAHAYFVTVHPFFDGNGRTARALTYMVLLKAGYDFFRAVPISAMIAESRSRYYKALRSCQDPANGNDFTYFAEYYAKELADMTLEARSRLDAIAKYNVLQDMLDPVSDRRLLKGAEMMLTEGAGEITASVWKEKMAVSFETARKDLMMLEKLGFLTKVTRGHKIFFCL